MSDVREFTGPAMVFVTAYLDALFDGRVEDAIGFYAADAEIIRYEGITRGDGIAGFAEQLVESRRGGRLVSVDRLVANQDTIALEATLDTEHGPIQTSDVFVRDATGSITRHIPMLRGYWGS